MTTDEIMALGGQLVARNVRQLQGLGSEAETRESYVALQSAIEALQRDLEHMRIERDEQARQNTLRKEILVTGNEMVRELNAQIEALQADAARYRWLRDHECNSLYLTRNDEHAANYMTAKDWIREHQEDFQDDDQAEVSRMKETNTIWTLQIYPHTPIGFNLWHGSTPDVAIDAAMALDKP